VIDEDLTNLDEWLRRLKVEYHIYFNGHRQKPPNDLKFRVEKLVKRLSESSSMSLSQRFRYNTLVTRFYVFRDLWRRTQAAKEQDGIPAAVPVKTESKGTLRSTPAKEISVSITDPAAEADKVRDLYNGLQSVRGAERKGFPDISYKQFSEYIATQTQGIREKSGCRRVKFKVQLEKDAVKFTAKADDTG
jgi:hypothetical protein